MLITEIDDVINKVKLIRIFYNANTLTDATYDDYN